MPVIVFTIVVIAALFAIGSGVWVATALISAISRNRTAQTKCQPVESLKVERKAERQPQSDANGRDI
jgi:hypothetical protein